MAPTARRLALSFLAVWIVAAVSLVPLTVGVSLAWAQDGGSEQPQTTEESADEGGGSEESGSEESGGSEDSGGGLSGMGGLATGFFNAIGTHIWDWTIGWLGEKVSNSMGDALLYLPDPSSDEQVTGVYQDVKQIVQGLLIVGIIVMSLAMIVRSANTGLNFAGLKILPRILAVAIVLGALPSLFGVLSTLATDLTFALLPESEQIVDAQREMVKAIASNLILTNFLNLILALFGVYVLFVLILVALLKAIIYVLLFIISPFPLIASLIPGFEKYASIWAKAVLVTAFIPAVWATELWLGAILITMPEALFGEMVNTLGFLSNGAFTTIIAIAMFYLIYKTPFIAFSWAIPSYNPSGGGSVWSFGKFAAKTAAAAGIKSVVGGAVGGLIGAGVAQGSQSDQPSRGERPPSDKLGGQVRQNIRRSEVRSTDKDGNVSTTFREEKNEEVSRTRNMEHDETMNYFGPRNTDGPGGSPPTPKTQTVGSGGRGGRLNRGDRAEREGGRYDNSTRSRDEQKVIDLGEED